MSIELACRLEARGALWSSPSPCSTRFRSALVEADPNNRATVIARLLTVARRSPYSLSPISAH